MIEENVAGDQTPVEERVTGAPALVSGRYKWARGL